MGKSAKSSEKFSVKPGYWYAYQSIGASANDEVFSCTPAYVEAVDALKSGKGILRLTLILAIHPVRAARYVRDLWIVSHLSDHLVATWKDDRDIVRTIVVSALSTGWIPQHCPQFASRFGNVVFNGIGFSSLDCIEYLEWHFGKRSESILFGVGKFDAPNPALDMPRENTKVLGFFKQYDPFDAYLIRRGVLPCQMEDKWHVYAKGDHLYFHRSWTGICIYDASIQQEGDKLELTSFTVHRKPGQYSKTDDEYEVAMLNYLVSVLLLHIPAEFPCKSDDPAMGALEAWSAVGISGA